MVATKNTPSQFQSFIIPCNASKVCEMCVCVSTVILLIYREPENYFFLTYIGEKQRKTKN